MKRLFKDSRPSGEACVALVIRKVFTLFSSDINECDNDIPGLCSQVCHNTRGSFKCSCLEGYVLDPDGRKCRASGM